jgi:hypothetical protein
MATMLTFVQGDTAPDIASVLHALDDPDTVVDLTGCTVRFQMRKADDRRFTVNALAEIMDHDSGVVRYRWGPNDLAVHGEYEVQWEITYPDARIQTTADTETILVRRQ